MGQSIKCNSIFDVPLDYTGHVEHISGTQVWLKDGRLHREDGPAVIRQNGTQIWYLDGIFYEKDDYYKELYKRKIITEQELFLELL